mgnify:CR=1 FL=1
MPKKPVIDKELFKRSVLYNVKTLYRKTLEEATDQQIFQAVSYAVKDMIVDNWIKTQENYEKKDPKIVYYMSMEFLMGRALGNNMINLMAYKEFSEALEELGLDINVIEDQEPDAALGNGGLGRLAACFLDSLATLGYAAYGCGIRYHYGMFKQEIRDGYQIEAPDDWLRDGNPFELRRPEYTKIIKFGGHVCTREENGRLYFYQEDYQSVKAVPYDMAVIGCKTTNINTLRLWQAEAINDFDFTAFNNTEYNNAVQEKNDAENITKVLYPNDNKYEGKVLRLKQQYFFCSASLQDIMRRYKKKHGNDFSFFAKENTIQLNDTHPVSCVPELVRLLMNEGFNFDDAFEIARKTFNYTNHTVLGEALEKWPADLMTQVIPEIYHIICLIANKCQEELTAKGVHEDTKAKMRIIDGNVVHMARLATYASTYVNGVAELHTEILKADVLKEWYQVYPERFQNKTNGITQRRWLGLCNPELSALITEKVGSDAWLTDLSLLEKLNDSIDTRTITKFNNIKKKKKQQLADYIKKMDGYDVNPDSIYDIQVKRLHEYKRQLLNAFSIMTIYFRLKDKKLKNWTPTTYIFGAKAAPGYARAKAIIKYINEIAKLVNNDPETKDLLQVYFISNYNVSYAEKIVVAADLSEQTSTAGLEASGTGNMKFMLNGAPTLGTLDGANVEIAECAGIENEYIFGAKVEDIERMKKEGYHPKALYDANPEIKRVVDTLIDGTFDDGGAQGEGSFKELHDSLLKDSSWQKADNYFLIYDLPDYVDTKIRANTEYANRKEFGKKCLINIANAGKFSSDRTILQYAKEIWHTSYKK